MIGLTRVRMSIICSENGLLVCSHGPLELAQSVQVGLWQGFLHTLILATRLEMHHRKETKELCAMIFVKGPEKLLVVIAHVGQMFLTRP